MNLGLLDVNAMIGLLPNEPSGGSAAELDAALATVGVREAVVGHVQAWQQDPAAGNQALLVELAELPHLHPCWVGLPDTCGELGTPARFVRDAQRSGVVAVRLFPADHGYPLAGTDPQPLLAALSEAALPVIVDADQTTWAEIEAMAHQHPDLAVVVCSVGYRTMRLIAGVLTRAPNVSVDLSYLGAHMALEWIVSSLGADRVLFGSGAPRRDPADAVTRLLWSNLDGADMRRIGAENLRSLLPLAART